MSVLQLVQFSCIHSGSLCTERGKAVGSLHDLLGHSLKSWCKQIALVFSTELNTHFVNIQIL